MKFNGMSPPQNAIMQSRSSFENLGSSSSHSLIFISTINMMYVPSFGALGNQGKRALTTFAADTLEA